MISKSKLSDRKAIDRRWLLRHWFYIVVLAFTWFQILLKPLFPDYTLLLLGLLVTGYIGFKMLQPVRWHQTKQVNLLLFTADLLVSAGLIFSSGGISSPFVLFSLTPVITAAILLEKRYTLLITTVTAGYMLVSFMLSSSPGTDAIARTNSISVYLLAVSLSAALPYVMNEKDRQKLQVRAVISERQKLAREIHDSLCQTIYGLRWQLQMSRNKTSDEDKMIQLLSDVENDARNLIGELRSFKAGCSLAVELKKSLSRYQDECGISFRLDENGQENDIDEVVKSEVLLICEEALRNAVKHSGCRHIGLRLTNSKQQLRVTINDDGCGLNDVIAVEGRGLTVMRERAEAVGGRLALRSADGSGTEVDLEVPVRCSLEPMLTTR